MKNSFLSHSAAATVKFQRRARPRLSAALVLALLSLPAADALADIRFQTDTPTEARSLTITVFNNAGQGYPIVITLDRSVIGKPDAAQLKASAIVSEITAASAGTPLNAANNQYKKPNTPFPFTAEQRRAGNPPKPDTLVTIKGTKRVMIGPDNTGEALDKIGPMGNGALTSVAFGGSGTATGENADGTASVVEAGIDGFFVATVNPSAGEPFSDVLAMLADELDLAGVPTMMDASTGSLELVSPINDAQSFDFGNTDTGFADFAIAEEIPEPGSLVLLLGAAFALAACRVRSHSGRRPT